MDCRLENMTPEETFYAAAGIETREEYDAYIEEMYQYYLMSSAVSSNCLAIDYGSYDCAGWDIYDY